MTVSGTETTYGDLRVHVDDAQQIGAAAADDAEAVVRAVLDRQREANVMLATGNSQLSFLDSFTSRSGVDWSRVRIFHMDEYVGLGPDHPAGFGKYIRERVVERLSPPPLVANYIATAATSVDARAECERYAALLRRHPLDLCVMGIGENGHLAFNDPGVADFADPDDLKVVELDEACRGQQVGEGHFAGIAEVPTSAITVTIPALLRAAQVIVVCPEARKAHAVSLALTGPIETSCPASILRRQAHARLYLDTESASQLS